MNTALRKHHLILGILILLTRLPFLDRGFGVEEDSWGTAVAIRNTLATGVFETSRLPGHPVNEFFYLLLWPGGSWLLNFSSAICSVVFTISFCMILERSGFTRTRALFLSFATALIPVIYINSTCTMDYLWGLMFMTLSWLMLIQNRTIFAGVFMGGMYLPLLWLLMNQSEDRPKEFWRFSLATGITTLMVFIPVIRVYGIGFFTYSDQFPYPTWPKVFYKMLIGVWGLPGLLALALWFITRRSNIYRSLKGKEGVFFLLTIFIFTSVYFVLPQKSAYMIAVIPVTVRFLGEGVKEVFFRTGIFLFCLSSFVLGFNLSDPYRGAEKNLPLAQFTVSGQELFLDAWGGPLLHDYSKRQLKNKYCKAILKRADSTPGRKAVICGWWYNQILIYSDWYGYPAQTSWIFYEQPASLEKRQLSGERIFFLAEQDKFNDLMYPSSSGRTIQREEMLP
jgi:hypothetical protein